MGPLLASDESPDPHSRRAQFRTAWPWVLCVVGLNLYGELLASIGESDPAFTATSPATYAVTFRGHKVNERTRLEEWAYPLVLGQPLPSLPIWLADDLHVILDLESAYEDTCKALRIR